ncbi:hypothetical protein ScPMuIL_003330 [Solemya velum]
MTHRHLKVAVFWCIAFISIYYLLVDVTNHDKEIDRNHVHGDFLQITGNPNINCEKIFLKDDYAIHKTATLAIIAKNNYRLTEQSYIEMTKNCSKFQSERGYIKQPITDEEAQFPVAMGILVYRHVDQVERLLRIIYRPQNIYCIHVDLKSRDIFHEAINAIANCFDNVIVSTKMFAVSWAEPTMLLADLQCMQDLWNTGHNWKYFLNLAGSEFPLRTNLEIVKILKIFNGFNDVEGTIKRVSKERWQSVIATIPANLQPIKGNFHIAVNRHFVEYVMTNRTSADLLSWVLDTHFPEETYYATLNHNPQLGIKGSYAGDFERKQYLGRHTVWKHFPLTEACHGEFVNGVCVFDLEDLFAIRSRPELFVNKFDISRSFAFDCLEEWVVNRTKEEIFGHSHFNATFYQTFIGPLVHDTLA